MLHVVLELSFVSVTVAPSEYSPAMLGVVDPVAFVFIAFRPNKLSLRMDEARNGNSKIAFRAPFHGVCHLLFLRCISLRLRTQAPGWAWSQDQQDRCLCFQGQNIINPVEKNERLACEFQFIWYPLKSKQLSRTQTWGLYNLNIENYVNSGLFVPFSVSNPRNQAADLCIPPLIWPRGYRKGGSFKGGKSSDLKISCKLRPDYVFVCIKSINWIQIKAETWMNCPAQKLWNHSALLLYTSSGPGTYGGSFVRSHTTCKGKKIKGSENRVWARNGKIP